MPVVISTVPAAHLERFGFELPEGWELKHIEPPATVESVADIGRDAGYLFTSSSELVSASLISALPALRLIHVEGVGFGEVDIDAARARGIPVCNNRAVNNGAVAEHTIGLMLAALRRTAHSDKRIKRDGYTPTRARFIDEGEHELRGKRVGIVGFGAIGREVAVRLAGWGCELCYYDAFRPAPEVERELKTEFLELDELLERCDIVSLHVPALPSTINMINARTLGLMKKTALLINTSRGEIVDSEALAEALEKGELYAAALDTVAPEPMPDDHPLLMMSPEAQERLTLTPHIGGTTDEAFNRMLKNVAENFTRVENGEKPFNVVNGL